MIKFNTITHNLYPKPNPGVMASGRDVVLPCVAAVYWTPVSDLRMD
ncbi:unnamed protein product [Camellia sinensis]